MLVKAAHFSYVAVRTAITLLHFYKICFHCKTSKGMNLNYFQISQIFIGIYLLMNGIEWLFLASNSMLKTFFSFNSILLRLQDRGLKITSVRSSFIKSLLSNGKFTRILAVLIILCGLSLIILPLINVNYSIAFILISAFVLHISFCASSGFGFEGADQMTSIVLFSLSIINLFPEATFIIQIFITTQLILSYGVSGIAKLFSRYWRSGEAILMILTTRSFGTGSALWLNDRPWLAKLISISVIIFEVAWFVIPFNNTVAVSVLSLGVLFHIINAYVMGLNLFLWAFISAYPLAIKTIFEISKY